MRLSTLRSCACHHKRQAEGVKTAGEAAVYGGTAGESYDTCYHLFCDGFSNVNQKGLDEMSDAIAHTVLVYSRRHFAKAPLLDPAQAATASLFGGEGGDLERRTTRRQLTCRASDALPYAAGHVGSSTWPGGLPSSGLLTVSAQRRHLRRRRPGSH